MSISLRLLIVVCVMLWVADVARSQTAKPPPTPEEKQIDTAIERMIQESNNIDPQPKAKVDAVFQRPHPMLTNIPTSSAPIVLDRMRKEHTGNLLKDAYIRFHLMYVLLQSSPEELKKHNKEIEKLSGDLPEIPLFEGREERRYEPPEVGAVWLNAYYRCRRMVGIPPFERWIDPPDSFQYMNAKERKELEPLWEKAKLLKFRTLVDDEAYVWNRRYGTIYHYLRLYEGEVFCARLASGDKSAINDALNVISGTAKSKPGIAADYIAYMSKAYMDGYLDGYDPDVLKKFAQALKPLVSTNTAWFNYQGRWRNLPEAAYHLINCLENEQPAPKWSTTQRPAATLPPRTAMITGDQLDLPTISAAIDHAVYGLSRIPRPELFLTWESYKAIGLVPEVYPYDLIQPGHQGLAVWGMLAAGESHQSAWMLRRINWVMLHETPSTYDRAMRLQALSMLPRTEWRDWYGRDVLGLLNAMSDSGGFVPEVQKDKVTGFGDNANSQYAIMGLWAAERAGQEVPIEAWRRIDNYWRMAQQPAKAGEPAGWAIKSFASVKEADDIGDFTTRVNGPMTAAGVMALSISERMLLKAKRAETNQSLSPQFQAGVKWLDANFSLDALDGDQDFYYYMWTIQNVGQATGYRTFNKIDWFRQATARLINNQQSNGLWSGPKGDMVSTSFALLYLYRANGPLAICKVRWTPPVDEKKRAVKITESWNNRPSDLYNLTEYISDSFETPTSWQIADLDQPVHELMETPILYLATDKSFAFSEEQTKTLRDFIRAGGLLLCVPEGRAVMQPLNSMKTLAKTLFPDIEAQKVDADGPMYSMFQKVVPAIPMLEINNGVRPLMIILEKDIDKDLQGGLDKGRDAFNLMANIYLYVSGREPRRPRLDTNYLLRRNNSPTIQVPAAVLGIAGQPNLEPAAIPQLAILLANKHNINLIYDTVAPASISAQKIAFLSVGAATTLDDASAAALAKWVQAGGTLWLDALGGSPDAVARLNAIIEQLGIKSTDLKPLDAASPVLTGQGLTGGYDNRTFKLRPFTHAPRSKAEAELKSATLGTGTVYVSNEDFTCGLAGLNHWGIQGYMPLFARQIVANSVLQVAAKK